MNTLRLNFGNVRLSINDDESKVIEFNPNDLSFVERFYNLISVFEAKEKEYKLKVGKLEKEVKADSYGIPSNMGARIALLKGICEDIKTEIDVVFGEGTASTVFGKALTLDMFMQFFDGITPYIKQARQSKVDKYLADNSVMR